MKFIWIFGYLWALMCFSDILYICFIVYAWALIGFLPSYSRPVTSKPKEIPPQYCYTVQPSTSQHLPCIPDEDDWIGANLKALCFNFADDNCFDDESNLFTDDFLYSDILENDSVICPPECPTQEADDSIPSLNQEMASIASGSGINAKAK